MAEAAPVAEEKGDRPWTTLTNSDNLTSLSELNQKTLLQAMKERFLQDRIYTDVGDILVAINPFAQLPCYSKDWLDAFDREDLSGFVPHIYKVGARAYNSMMQGKKDQVCVISGESGAGKTESSKLIMRQIMHMCKSSAGVGSSLQHKITQLNPILEAFGNARTVLNNNSSRFGKFLQLVFESNGRIIGAGLEQYLLEKSRVCVQGDGERNFHIFYYLYAGVGQSKLDKLYLKPPTSHNYLRKCSTVMKECASEFNKAEFLTVVNSMMDIGFDEEEIEEVYIVLAAIILIGDIEFVGADGGQDNAAIKNREAAELVAKLLGLESSKDLCFALVTLRTETRGEAVDKRYKCSKAADVRDGLAKALYSRLFQWIISRLNNYLQPYPTSHQLNIGILDIFGFENFNYNSFEQFCINLANEQLQCYFNHQIFAMEQMELMKEGLNNLGDLSYKDNQPVLDLFLTKPIGLLSLLDEQCRGLNGTEKSYVQRCKDSFKKHSNFVPDKGSSLQFTVRHYAGNVLYKIQGFVDKNKDSLPDMLVDAVRYCGVKLVSTLFRRSANPSSELKKSVLRKSQRTLMRAMSRKSMRKKGRGKPQKTLTVSGHFQQSLKELMERIFAASPHFVRCIKPNYEKLPRRCDDDFMLKQLTYTGMLEAVRVRREGFAFRPFFSDFFNCYHSLAFYFTDPEVRSSEASCEVILGTAGLTGWQMGKSRVFLRYFHEERLNLMLRDMENKATLIQKIYRGHTTRKYTIPLREKQKREKQMATKFFGLLSQHGKEYVDTLISLNTKDILLAKERFGHRRKRSVGVLSSHDSFKLLTEDEKKVRKVQQFGVRLIPELKLVENRRDKEASHDDEETMETFTITLGDTESHDTDSTLDFRLSPPPTPPPPQIAPPTPVPRVRRSRDETTLATLPRSKRLSSPTPLPRMSRTLNRSGSKLQDDWRPVPTPRQRHKSEAAVPSGGHPGSPAPIPRPRSRIRNSTDIVGIAPGRPIPKPRKSKSSTSSDYQVTPQNSLEVYSPEPINGEAISHSSCDKIGINHGNGAVYNNAADDILSNIPVPTYILDARSTENIQEDLLYLDPNSTQRESVYLDPNPTQRESNYQRQDHIQDSALTELQENCEEELQENCEESPPPPPPPPTTDHTFSPKHKSGNVIKRAGSREMLDEPRMSRNLDDLRIRANSATVRVQEEDSSQCSGGRTASVGSWFRHHLSQGPPMADKRKAKKKWRLSGSSNTSDNTSPYTGQVMGVVMTPSLLELAEEEESDVDLLGFYPNFNHDRAMEYVLGQSRGTYVIYQDRERLNGRNLPRYILLVSLGRLGESTYHIHSKNTTENLHGLLFYLAEANGHSKSPIKGFSYLKGLVEYYRSHEIQPGLTLSQPRLLAGVQVRAARMQPLLHRKHLN